MLLAASAPVAAPSAWERGVHRPNVGVPRPASSVCGWQRAAAPGLLAEGGGRRASAPRERAEGLSRTLCRAAVDSSDLDTLQFEGQGNNRISHPDCGANLMGDGSCSFRVWAPAAKEAFVFLYAEGEAHSDDKLSVPMESEGNGFMRVSVEGVQAGQLYHFGFRTHWGAWHDRRDPYARATEANTHENVTCVVVDPSYDWDDWEVPPLHSVVIYECHVGSFTGYHDPEVEGQGTAGTFAAVEGRLGHIADCGFTAIQLMPVIEFSGSWGYNPRLLFPTHGQYGTPEELRSLVNSAHKLGLAVIIDSVLHHGAARSNSLWDYDGWSENGNGGIYHEGAKSNGFGTSFAFYKHEVQQMLYDSCSMLLREYNADGVRIDAAQLLPWHLQQTLTFKIRNEFPGRFIIAESNPCHHSSVYDAGFDSVWEFSSFFDGLKQARRGGAAEKMDLNILKKVLYLPHGFQECTQVVKFVLGSHDQIGCRNSGGHHNDTNMRHRHGVEYLGGRQDWGGRARARMWYAIMCTAQGIPMSFMGTEVCHSGFWHIDEHNRFNWDFARDEIGLQTMAAVRDINRLRSTSTALGYGTLKTVNEDWNHGTLVFERFSHQPTEPHERLIVVINTGGYQCDDPTYRVRCGGEKWREVYNSQAAEYGGWEGSGNAGEALATHDHCLHIRLPKYSVLIFTEEV